MPSNMLVWPTALPTRFSATFQSACRGSTATEGALPKTGSSAICDRLFGLRGVVPHPTQRARLRQSPPNTSLALAPDTRVGPHRVITAPNRIIDPVLCFPGQLAAPFCLKPVVSNDSGVLNGSRHWRPFHLSRSPVQKGK